jgi:hypothetical protein
MITENKMIYDIWEHLRGHISDNDDIDERWIYQQIYTRRANYLSKDFSTGLEPISEDYIQDLGCVELENADAVECCIDIDSGCVLKRTVLEIPRTIMWGTKPALTHIGGVQKDTPRMALRTYSQALFSGFGIGNSRNIFVFPLMRRLYFLMRNPNNAFKGLKWANIRGVFVDPRDVVDFTRCDGGLCYSEDAPYPLNEKMWDAIKMDILKNSGVIKSLAPTDNVNDQKHKIDGGTTKG